MLYLQTNTYIHNAASSILLSCILIIFFSQNAPPEQQEAERKANQMAVGIHFSK